MPYDAVPSGRWLADRILEVDKINPQNAASLSACFTTFRRYDQHRQQVCFVSLLRGVSLALLVALLVALLEYRWIQQVISC